MSTSSKDSAGLSQEPDGSSATRGTAKSEEDLTFIGASNSRGIPVSGETAKNQMFLGYFSKRFRHVKSFDTFKWRRSPILMLRLMLHLILARNRVLVLSLSTDSAYALSRILHFVPKKKPRYYFVVGGGMTNRVRQKGYRIEYYRQYDKMFVQGKRMVQELREMGLDNAEYISNCRNFNPSLLTLEKPASLDGKVRFVFMSRITEEKGVAILLDSIADLDAAGMNERFEVTFYGPIAQGLERQFHAALNTLPNAAYRGILNLQSQEGYELLSTYDMMVFPTFWHGEGFPGVIVDAFVAGLPVLASDWNLNSEVVEEGKTGYLIEACNLTSLTDKMKHVIENPDELVRMSRNCRTRAKDFHVDAVLSAVSL